MEENKSNEEKNEAFTYTYSAREQEEIKRIRDKYASPGKEESSIERLRRLDASAARGATVISLIMGIVGALLLGVGMCCAMVPGWEAYFVPGIAVGIIGILCIIAAYPLYARMVRRKREKLAPEIMRLTDELMK